MSPGVDVSVIVSTCDRAENTRSLLMSLQEVKVRPDTSWELVLVNNGSTDNTDKVVNYFLQHAHYFITYLYEKRRGKSQGLNTGIAAASGKILAFTDDDVYTSPDWVQVICDYFKNNH